MTNDQLAEIQARAADAHFHAHAHEDVLALIAEIGRLRAVVENAYQASVEAVPYASDYHGRLAKIKAALAEARGEAYP